jgi:hypothetical protein
VVRHDDARCRAAGSRKDADLVVHFSRLPVLAQRAVLVRIVDEERAPVSGAVAR